VSLVSSVLNEEGADNFIRKNLAFYEKILILPPVA
jgi:hypothetical protein